MDDFEQKLKAQNRIDLGLSSYFVDGDINNFDEKRLEQGYPTFNLCSQWNDYRDNYIKRFDFNQSDDFWHDFFHQYRNMDHWYNDFEDEREKSDALKHHQSQVNAVTKCRFKNSVLYEAIGELSIKSPNDRTDTILKLNDTDEDQLVSMALMTKLTYYSKNKIKQFWYI